MLLTVQDPELRRTTFRLSLFQLIAWGVLFYAFSVILPEMKKELGWSTSTLSGGLSLAILLSGLLAPISGKWIDRNGYRNLLLTGGGCGVVGLLLWSASATVLVYYLAWSLIGLAMATTLYTSTFAAVVWHSGHHSINSIKWITFGGALASTVFLPLTTYLAQEIGWRSATVLLSILYFTFVIYVFWFFPSSPSRTVVEVENPSQAICCNRTHQRTCVVGALLLTDTANITVMIFGVSYISSSGLSIQTASTLVAMVGVAKLVGRLLAAIRLPLIPVYFFVLVLEGAAVSFPLFTQNVIAFILMLLIFGAIDGLQTIIKPLILAELYGRENFGKVTGTVKLLSTLLTASVPIGFGFLHQMVGWNYSWSLVPLALFSAASLVALAKVMKDDSRERKP